MSGLGQRLLGPLFPPTCILCGAPGEANRDLCGECLADLPLLGPCCQRCALPLAEPGICGACLSHPPQFDACHIPLLYQGPVPRLITGLKFHNQLANARLLAQRLQQHLHGRDDLPELILPVPLHPRRMRERGYNQAIEIARPLGRALGLPVAIDNCVRRRATGAQADLPKKQRQKNLRGAFAVNRPINARHVAVLDDVVTTGSTVNELARVLKQAGVERVVVWALARTP